MVLKEKVSIIIPFYNNSEITVDCLKSLYEASASSNIDYEIILVDDASTESFFFEKVANYFSEFKLIRNQTNQGFAKSCNRGAANATCKYLVFLNNDTLALKGWLEGLLSVYQSDPLAGIVGSRLLYEDGTIQHAGVCFDDDGMPFHIYHRFPSTFVGVNKVREFQAVTGACFLIEASLFNELGGFDEQYLNGMEDIDLSLRVCKAGRKVIYSPKSTLYHLEAKTRGKAFVKHGDNLAIFTKRWGVMSSNYLQYYRVDVVNGTELPGNILKIKQMKEENNDLVLAVWGAGADGRHLFAFLKFINLLPQYFIDSDPKKWGREILGVPIFSPEQIKNIKNGGKQIFIWIASVWFREIHTTLEDLGFKFQEEFI